MSHEGRASHEEIPGNRLRELREPLPIKPPPRRRAAVRNVGVWSPFGHAFNPHGEVELALGRKPKRTELSPTKEEPRSSDHHHSLRPVALQQHMGAAAVAAQVDMPFAKGAEPPVFKRGLGLGLGLHPQRFPRELLKSSQSRLISCSAGYGAVQPGLGASSSEPSLLPTQQSDGANAADPVHRLYPFTAGAPAPAEEPPRGDADTSAASNAASKKATEHMKARAAELAKAGLLLDDADDEAPISDLDRALARLPLGRRCQTEFKQVQRESRLKLQEALTDRQRLRDSVFALKHAQLGLGPMVIDRRAAALGERSNTLGNNGFGGGGGAMTTSASVPELARASSYGGGDAERRRAPPSGPPLSSSVKPAGGKRGGAAPAQQLLQQPLQHPLGKLGQPTLWHEATAHISVGDGGVLRLWQALREKAEQPRSLPAALDVEEASALVERLFEYLHQRFDANGGAQPPVVGTDLVEDLFKACSSSMIHTDGAREVLLPLLRVAAECGSVTADETRRLSLMYAHPQPDDSPKSKRNSPDGYASACANAGFEESVAALRGGRHCRACWSLPAALLPVPLTNPALQSRRTCTLIPAGTAAPLASAMISSTAPSALVAARAQACPSPLRHNLCRRRYSRGRRARALHPVSAPRAAEAAEAKAKAALPSSAKRACRCQMCSTPGRAMPPQSRSRGRWPLTASQEVAAGMSLAWPERASTRRRR